MRLPVVTIDTQTLAGGATQLNQIRYFLVLYEEHNCTRAAPRCGVSQLGDKRHKATGTDIRQPIIRTYL